MIEAGTIVSTDTLRTEDLVLSFSDVLERFSPSRAMELRRAYHAVYMEFEADGMAQSTDDHQYLIEDLFDAIQEIAPDGCYFGSSEGDGACFGFFPYEDGE